MASRMTSQRALASAAAAATVAFAMLGSAQAQPLTWDGGGANQFFGTAANWNPDAAPTSADDVSFAAQPSAPAVTPLWEAADSVNSLSIDNSGGYVWSILQSGSANPRSITIGVGGLTVIGGGTSGTSARATTVSGNQTWNIASGTTFKFLDSGSIISGTGTITKTGAGTINLFGNSTGFTGGWNITAGTVTNAGGGATNTYGTGATNVSGTGVLDLNITGAGSVSGGAVTLANGGTLSGRSGTLATGDTGVPNINPSALAVDSTTNATVIIKATTSGENFRINPTITGGLGVGNSTIRIQGPGEVHLINGSSFNGTWKVESAGTLRWETSSTSNTFGNAASVMELNGGTLKLAGSSGSTPYTWSNGIQVTGNSSILIDKTGAAGTAATNSGGTTIARGFGPITIGANTLSLGVVTAKVTGPQNAGNLMRIGGGSVTLTGNATFNVADPYTGTSGFDFAATTITDNTGGFGFTKTGGGFMSVSGASTYSGPTTVTGGILRFFNTGGLGTTSAISVASGTQVQLQGGGTNNWSAKANLTGSGTIAVTGGTGNTFTAQGAGISPGDTTGKLSLTGNLALALNGSTRDALNIDVTGGNAVAGTDYDQLAVSGTLTGLANADLVVNLAGVTQADMTGDVLTIATSTSNFTGLSFNSVTVNGGTATVSYNPGSITLSNITVAGVPEPTSLALLGLGGLLLARRGGKQRRA